MIAEISSLPLAEVVNNSTLLWYAATLFIGAVAVQAPKGFMWGSLKFDKEKGKGMTDGHGIGIPRLVRWQGRNYLFAPHNSKLVSAGLISEKDKLKKILATVSVNDAKDDPNIDIEAYAEVTVRTGLGMDGSRVVTEQHLNRDNSRSEHQGMRFDFWAADGTPIIPPDKQIE